MFWIIALKNDVNPRTNNWMLWIIALKNDVYPRSTNILKSLKYYYFTTSFVGSELKTVMQLRNQTTFSDKQRRFLTTTKNGQKVKKSNFCSIHYQRKRVQKRAFFQNRVSKSAAIFSLW